MTALSDRLQRMIRINGPITVAQFMAEVLNNPVDGYYGGAPGPTIGATGDFTTAPEVSQIFGELVGLWCADYWRRLGAPRPVRLVELGPGRGTLMADALRAANTVPTFRDAIDLHLVETNAVLKRKQATRLAVAQPTWHDTVAGVPDGPTLLIANEFFDALPIHQFVASGSGWRERLIGPGPDGQGLAFCNAPGPTPALALLSELGTPDRGAVVEACPAAISLANDIGAHLAAWSGAALIIDYGADHGRGDSLQAVRRHRRSDVLAEPGNSDLSAHVDFSAVRRAAVEASAVVYGPRPQGAFLRALGIETRAATLKRTATVRQSADIDDAVVRLTAADQMGASFKALAITGPDQPPPAGFEGS